MKRPRLVGIIVTLLLLDGTLLGVYAARRAGEGAGTWRVPATHERVAGAFAALDREGLGASLDTLERAATQDSAVLRDGHQLAHALGRRALGRASGDAGVIGECRPIFASGCYHGVVESFLHTAGRIDMAHLERMCAAAGSEARPAPVYECMHGLGHGVLGAVDLDVWPALHHCDALSESRFAASCREGVFMEAINSALARPHHGEGHAAHEHGPRRDSRFSLDPNNPYAPCDRFADPYAASCWLFQGFVILRHRDFDPAGALRTCDAAPGGRAGRCYEGIGLQLTGVFQRDDAWIIEQCAKGRPELAPSCAAGATVALTAMDWSGTRAAGFCGVSPAAWKEACYRAAGAMLAVFASPSRRAEVCASIEGEYAEACRLGAALDRRV